MQKLLIPEKVAFYIRRFFYKFNFLLFLKRDKNDPNVNDSFKNIFSINNVVSFDISIHSPAVKLKKFIEISARNKIHFSFRVFQICF